MTLRNTQLKNGHRITWTQYPTKAASTSGRQRTGRFWALAPQPRAIWVRPDMPEPGEPAAIKVYRTLRDGGLTEHATAYDDDLTASAA